MNPITKYQIRPVSFRTLHAYAQSGFAFRRWYRQANLVVKRLAAYAECSLERAADILAITSPRCAVNRNLTVAYAYLTTGQVPRDVIRSTRAALLHYEKTGKIRGPKTSAFAAALKGDNTRIVVDSHVARACGYDEHLASRKWARTRIERRISRLARLCGWSRSETQAALWAGYYRKAYPTGRVPMYNLEVIVPF